MQQRITESLHVSGYVNTAKKWHNLNRILVPWIAAWITGETVDSIGRCQKYRARADLDASILVLDSI